MARFVLSLGVIAALAGFGTAWGEEPKPQLTFDGTKVGAIAITYDAGGRLLVAGHKEKAAEVWDAAANKRVANLEGNPADVRSAQFASAGKRLLVVSSREYKFEPGKPIKIPDYWGKVWDVTTGKAVGEAKLPPLIGGLRFSPDGAWAVSPSNTGGFGGKPPKGAFSFYRVDGQEGFAIFEPTASRADAAAYVPGKDLMACATCVQLPGGKSGLGDVVLVTPPKDILDKGKVHKTVGSYSKWMRELAVSPDVAHVAGIEDEVGVLLWKVPAGQIDPTAKAAVLKVEGGEFTALAFSPDGKFLATGAGTGEKKGDVRTNGEVRLWKVGDQTAAGTWKSDAGPPKALAFAPDGKQFAVLWQNGTVHAYEVPQPK